MAFAAIDGQSWRRLLLFLLVLLLVVTAIQFSRGYEVIHYYPIGQDLYLGDSLVKVQEITLTGTRGSFNQEDRFTFFQQIVGLPPALQRPALFLLFLFRAQPPEPNSYTVEIHGLFVEGEGAEVAGFLGPPQVDIFLHTGSDGQFPSGVSWSWGQDSNVVNFSADAPALSSADTTFRVVFQDRATGEEAELLVKPQWETVTYNRLVSAPPRALVDPRETLWQVVVHLTDGEWEEVEAYVVGQDFPWENLNHDFWGNNLSAAFNYLGSWERYDQVFTYDLCFRQNTPDRERAGQQRFYVVDTPEGWLVVGADRIEVMGEENCN